jgi:hypothetical protein
MSVTDLRPKAFPAANKPAPFDQIRQAEARAASMASLALLAVMEDLAAIAERCADLADLSTIPFGKRDLMRRTGERIVADLKSVDALGARGAR